MKIQYLLLSRFSFVFGAAAFCITANSAIAEDKIEDIAFKKNESSRYLALSWNDFQSGNMQLSDIEKFKLKRAFSYCSHHGFGRVVSYQVERIFDGMSATHLVDGQEVEENFPYQPSIQPQLRFIQIRCGKLPRRPMISPRRLTAIQAEVNAQAQDLLDLRRPRNATF